MTIFNKSVTKRQSDSALNVQLPLQADSSSHHSIAQQQPLQAQPPLIRTRHPPSQPAASLPVNHAFAPLSKDHKSVDVHASISDFVTQHRAHNPSHTESQCRRVSRPSSPVHRDNHVPHFPCSQLLCSGIQKVLAIPLFFFHSPL